MLPFYFVFMNLGSCSYAFLYQLRDRNLILLVKKWGFYSSHLSPEVRVLRKQTNRQETQETHEIQYHWQCSIYPCDENQEELFFLLKCTFSWPGLELSPGTKLEASHLQLLLWLFFCRLSGEKSTSIPKLPSHLDASRAQDRGNWTFVFLHCSLMWACPHHFHHEGTPQV